MIPHAQDEKFISHGVKSNNQFKLMQNSSIMDILSNRIYSDKFAAVLREIGCNAYDAHVAAGIKNKPFLVVLPTDRDPRLIIRDYGTGLKPEDVIELYTTYGFSSKIDSNDYVGFMGIGSKSPFCYSSTFEVNSFFNHKKHSFLMFKDDENIPNVNQFGTIDTDEENGLEVIIPVSKGDIYKFQAKAQEIYEWFDVPPTIRNANFTFQSKGRHFTSLNGIRIGIDGIYQQQSFVKMGNVVYSLDRQQIPSLLSRKNFLGCVNFLLEFNIGEVEVDSGREKLQYTKKVIAAIESKLKEIITAIKADIDSKLSGKNKVAVCKKICNDFFGPILQKYRSAYSYSYSATDEVSLSICDTFKIDQNYLSTKLNFDENNYPQLDEHIKVQKNGKSVVQSEEKYLQNSLYKLGEKYAGHSKYEMSLQDYSNVDLLSGIPKFFFYKEGTSYNHLREYMKDYYPTDKGAWIFPARCKAILDTEFDINDPAKIVDIDVSGLIIPRKAPQNKLTFPVKVLNLNGLLTNYKEFTPEENTLYITVPFKYGKIECDKAVRVFNESSFRDKLSHKPLDNDKVVQAIIDFNPDLMEDKDQVLFLLVNSKNKKQIDNSESYIAIEKFLEIVTLDASNKKRYPLLEDEDVLYLYSYFLNNRDLLPNIKKAFNFSKTVIPLLSKNHPLQDLISKDLEKEVKELDEIQNILSVNNSISNLFQIEKVSLDIYNKKEPNKVLIKFNKYLNTLNNLEYSLNLLEKAS